MDDRAINGDNEEMIDGMMARGGGIEPTGMFIATCTMSQGEWTPNRRPDRDDQESVRGRWSLRTARTPRWWTRARPRSGRRRYSRRGRVNCSYTW